MFNVTQTHIAKTPGTCGGKPRIAGRRITVQNIYIWYDLMGLSADEIAQNYDLNLGQIHAALTYAYEHIDEIRMDIREDEEFVAEFMKKHPSKLKPSVDEIDDDTL